MHLLTTLLAADSPPADTSEGSGMMMWIPLVLMFLIMYIIVIRPQNKERRKRTQMMEDLKKNDKVLTAGGIHGVITALRDGEVTVRIDEAKDVKIRINRSAVSAVLNTEEDKSEK